MPGGWDLAARAYLLVCLVIGGVVFPGTTLLRALRRPVAGAALDESAVDLAAETRPDSTLTGRGTGAWILRLPGNQSLRLARREGSIELPRLPAELDGLTIVHLTDLHMAPGYALEFFERVADAAADWEADLVVLTGDLIEDNEAIAWIEPVVRRLRGRLGTFAILGNHDRYYDVEALRRAMAHAGIVEIDGRWTTVEARGRPIRLGGTSAPWGPSLPAADPRLDGVRIVLSHTPDRFPTLARHGVDLVVSGHNHGGQVRLPGIGPVLMPSRYCRRFDEGWFAIGDARLFVSRGIGASHPYRWGAVPEITRLVLRSPTPPQETRPAAFDRRLIQHV